MIDTTNAKRLVIENENNKLEQQTFTQIHFAPPRASFNAAGVYRGVFIEKDFERVYVIDNKGKPVFVRLTNFLRISFSQINNTDTKECSGIESHLWKYIFKKKYPATTDQTEMAIYYYEKAE